MTEEIEKQAATDLQDFDKFVQTVIDEWKIQGLAMAIVRQNEVIFSRGFGLRDVQAGQEVTVETLFPIASCTKAFTTAALALLVDQGKLDWDTPIRSYVPDFRLYDSLASERITARDLVSHRSGLPRHDLVWYHNNRVSRQGLFERLRYLKPTKDFRSFWQYQNLMFMAAGYLIEVITGQTWETFVHQQLFEQLEMTNSNFSIEETVRTANNYSHPYKKIKEEIKEISFYGAQGAIAPAGGIVSSVSEMSHWLRLHLNRGRYNDKQVISPSQITLLHTPQMIMPETSLFPEQPYASYALGWFVEPYRGYPMIHHGGNIDGFSSLTTLFPREQIGMVVLTNMSNTPVPTILTLNAFERLLELDEVPWSTRLMKQQITLQEAGEQIEVKSASDRVPDTHPSHPLDSYCGAFEHPGYGVITISQTDANLQAEFHELVIPLKHYHYDIFELNLEEFEITIKVSFLTDVNGDINTLIAPLEPTGNDITFKRVPASDLLSKEFLESFVGEYTLLDMRSVVHLKGEQTLMISVMGQPDYELVPRKGTEFLLRGISGSSVEFLRDEADQVTGAVLSLPYGVFTAQKLEGSGR